MSRVIENTAVVVRYSLSLYRELALSASSLVLRDR